MILEALGLSLLAGLATGIGGLIGVIKKPGKKLFGFLMGFTAGLMLTISFMELLAESWEIAGYQIAIFGFLLGALFMMGVDALLPHIRFSVKEKGFLCRGKSKACDRLFKVGILTMIGITIHNLPEGVLIGAGYSHLPKFGLVIALAIAIHNIPEGIATAVPLYKSGVSKLKSLGLATFSGLVEPIGALVALLFLKSFTSFVPFSLAFAGGVMIFITLDELIPVARKEHEHMTALGILTGIVFMMLISGFFGL